MRLHVDPRPGDRLEFTRREVLLTTPEERRKLSPFEEHLLDAQRFELRQELRRHRMSYDACQTKAMEDVAAGIPDPEKSACLQLIHREPSPARPAPRDWADDVIDKARAELAQQETARVRSRPSSRAPG